jgi:hypothetical protein
MASTFDETHFPFSRISMFLPMDLESAFLTEPIKYGNGVEAARRRAAQTLQNRECTETHVAQSKQNGYGVIRTMMR